MMVEISKSEIQRVEQVLWHGQRSGTNRRECLKLVQKVRGWLAVGNQPPATQRKLEALIGRFANARF